MHDLVIIGSGLAGLFAANVAVENGLSVHIISRGRGGLSLSHGCIGLYNSANPSRSLKTLPQTHPYRIVPSRAITDSFRLLKRITAEGNLGYSGGISSTISLLSPSGIPFKSSLAPPSLRKGRLDDPRPITIAAIRNFRDFWAEELATRAKRFGVSIQAVCELPIPYSPRRRDVYATDLADLLSNSGSKEEIFRAWKPKLAGSGRVGFPAIFGLNDSEQLIQQAEDYLNVEIFEIPTLPPSCAGLRLENLLKHRLQEEGIQLTEGPMVTGRVDGRSKGRLAAGVQLETVGGLRALDAKFVLLTTGGFIHGGLKAHANGHVYDSVFGLPVSVNWPRSEWTSKSIWKKQRYAQLGLLTDANLRPITPDGKPYLDNVFAAGGILAGPDRSVEGSRQGIDLSTAYHAVQSITKSM